MGGCNIQQRDGLKWIGFQDFTEIAHNLRDVLAGRPGTLLTYYVQGRLWQSPLAPQQLLRELGLRPKQVVRQLALDMGCVTNDAHIRQSPSHILFSDTHAKPGMFWQSDAAWQWQHGEGNARFV